MKSWPLHQPALFESICVDEQENQASTEATTVPSEEHEEKAIDIYGLTFDKKLDDLLGTGLKANTLTYLLFSIS